MSAEEKNGKIIDKGRDTVLKLPFSFEVAQALDSYPLVITILQTLQAADLQHLSSSTIDNSSISKALDSEADSGSISKVIFKVSEQIGAGLSTISTSYFFVKVQKRLADKDQRLAIIYKIKKNYYGIAYLAEGINFKDIAVESNQRIASFGTKEIIVDYMSLDEDLHLQGSDDMEIDQMLENFSMDPPMNNNLSETKSDATNSANDANILVSPSSIEDPVIFLKSRYYNTLYSLTTPLSYIPKTAIARFRNLCSNDNRKISDLLAGLCLSVHQMDARHHGKHGVLQLISSENVDTNLQISKLEIQNQQDFISRHEKIIQDILKTEKPSSNHPIVTDAAGKVTQESSEKKFQRIVLELKMREAQLQTILLFELLHSWDIDESNFLESNAKKLEKEEKKRAKESNVPLVRKKKSKSTRKIVPTFLGMGVDVNENSTTFPTALIDQLTVYKNLNAIVDRMGLWDMLLGSSEKKDNENSIGFIAYVLVPYYNKKLPSIVKYVVDRVKDSNLKMKVNKAERKLTSRKDSPELPSNTPNETTHTPIEEQKKKSSKYKKVVLTRKVPKLEKSLTSGLEDEYNLKPALSLKRSSSNLSYKNLKKRLVDLNDSTVEKNSSNSKANRSNSLSEKSSQQTQSFIFGNAKKTRLKSTVPQRNHSSAQILATPMKNKSAPIIPIAYTDLKRASITDSHSQVEATPNNAVRVIDMSDVINTPEDHFVNLKHNVFTQPKSHSVSDKLMSVSLAVDNGSHITSSPVKSPGFQSNVNITTDPIQVESTPIASVRRNNIINSANSSKSKKKSKPGEPVSAMESPFYRARWNGSPSQPDRNHLMEQVISDDELPSEQAFTFSGPSSKTYTDQSDNESD
ncbi:predicted protein, partial [Scheffersomyces stipitis CBS 6054]